MERVTILNVPIDNLSMTELLEKLGQTGGIVFTPNTDHLVKLQKDEEFCTVYGAATYRTCDSQALVYVSKFLGTPIQEKISGSDLFPAFYNYYGQDESVKIFLLGAAEGVAATAQQRINEKVGREIIIAAHSPTFGFEKDEAECQKLVELVNQSGATVLAIGVGAPKQEKWLYKYYQQMPNIKTFFAIGATIDFEAGKTKRAPVWISNLGMEWVYRLVSEPKRLWKRYLVDDLVPFSRLVLSQKFGLYQPKYPIPMSDRD